MIALFAPRRGPSCRARRGVARVAALIAVALLLSGTATTALAQQLDLSLNLFYNTPTNRNSGGTWIVVGRSDSFGIASAGFRLAGVETAEAAAPTGEVNDGDRAGFNFFSAFGGGSNEVVAFQFPLTPAQLGLGEQGLFYGVGTQADGQPGDVGPTLTTLTNTFGVPWGVTGSDFLGDATWDIAVPLAIGQFQPNSTPAFAGASPVTAAGIFTTVGTSTTAGTVTEASTITTIVRDNLMVLPGDFNFDGTVNAADYVTWRDNLGAADETPISDAGDGMNGVDQADYLVWVANFGNNGAGAGSGSAAPIPEPATAIFALLGALAASFIRKK